MEKFIALEKARKIVQISFSYIKRLDKYDPLRNQASRSAISVVSNLAEGNERTGKDRNQLFKISKGSLSELKEQLLIMFYEKGFDHDLLDRIEELHKILYSLSRSQSQSQSQKTKTEAEK